MLLAYTHSLLLAVGCGLALLIFSGALTRRRFSDCYSFCLYQLALFVPQALMEIRREEYYTRDFWLATETAHQVLKLAIVLELSGRTLAAFPGARHTVRAALLVVLLVLCALLLATVEVPEYGHIVTDLMPRLMSGTVWLFCVLGLVIAWYRIPMTPLQKAVLLGFCVYLLLYAASLWLIAALEWRFRASVNLGTALVYTGTQIYWAWAAWRPLAAVPPSAEPEALG